MLVSLVLLVNFWCPCILTSPLVSMFLCCNLLTGCCFWVCRCNLGWCSLCDFLVDYLPLGQCSLYFVVVCRFSRLLLCFFNVGVGDVYALTLRDCASSSCTLADGVRDFCLVCGLSIFPELLGSCVEDCIHFVALLDYTSINSCV